MDVYDIDTLAGEFAPVRVKLRGKEYEMGGTAYSILAAASKVSTDETDEDSSVHQVLKQMRPMLALLCPEMEEDTREVPLTAAEEMALLAPVTEVMERVGRLTFRREEDAQG